MDFLNGLVGQLLGNPQMQMVALGLVVKFAVDKLKVLFQAVDANGVPEGYKIPLQMVVIIMSGLVTMGDLALKGQLSTFDPTLITNFLTVALPAYLSAMGIHFGAKIALKEVEKNKNAA